MYNEDQQAIDIEKQERRGRVEVSFIPASLQGVFAIT
jgi:hypothetical protein